MSYSLDDLLFLMDQLRDPEQGCPWDLKQDFKSIVPHTLEEAYEVADTIEREDWAHLEDELGDLLFQVVFYSRLGKETQRFDFSSVINSLVTKLVRRHPHVFADGQLYGESRHKLSTERVSANWEAIKQQEREGKSLGRLLDDVPTALPALSRAAKLQKRAAKVGFDWEHPLDVLDKIQEELDEVREAIQQGDQAAVAAEMGDLLFAQVNLARHLKVDPEHALRGTNRKFENRFGFVEDQVNASARDWPEFTLAELDQFWDQAKQLEEPK